MSDAFKHEFCWKTYCVGIDGTCSIYSKPRSFLALFLIGTSFRNLMQKYSKCRSYVIDVVLQQVNDGIYAWSGSCKTFWRQTHMTDMATTVLKKWKITGFFNFLYTENLKIVIVNWITPLKIRNFNLFIKFAHISTSCHIGVRLYYA